MFWARARSVTPLARMVGSAGNKAFIPDVDEKEKERHEGRTMRGKEGEKKNSGPTNRWQ